MLPEARLRLAAAETALHVAPERSDDDISRLTVWAVRIRRFARDDCQVVGSLKVCARRRRRRRLARSGCGPETQGSVAVVEMKSLSPVVTKFEVCSCARQRTKHGSISRCAVSFRNERAITNRREIRWTGSQQPKVS